MGLNPAEWDALRLSVQIAVMAVIASLPFGVFIGWLLAKKEFPGKMLLELVVMLPLVLPPVVTGFLLLMLLGRQGLLGGWLEQSFGVRLVFDWKGAAVASAIVSFPLMVRAIRLSFAAIDPRWEQMARSLGARRVDAFWSVTLPLARPGIIAGSVLAFARCIGEFGATIMLAGNIPGETRTIPLFIYNQLEVPGGWEQSYKLVIVSVLISAAALLAGELLDRRGKKRLYVV
ncbi:MAG: molybdate ABC transporter permease subunit [Planctomycetota bacterium]|nr:molybdate ABC transporter permease subunit [Planctomycetota bacterium]MDA1211437.1 molybdate ABC transporter permease subunit [Planctomycetota bacterium]